MKKKTFVSPQKGRMIEVVVNPETGYVTFHYSQERGREFYSIPIPEWVADLTNRLDRPDNWHNHMMEKNWFSQPMKDFITNATTGK